MDYDAFLNWLLAETNMSQRAAKDVISRCKRVCRLTKQDLISQDTLNMLNTTEEFNAQSMFVKSQLRRAITLWNIFKGECI